MRRPLLIIFVLILFVAFIKTNQEPLNNRYTDKTITIEGIVMDKIEKEKYHQYKVSKFLVNDYSKNKKIAIGKRVRVIGKLKNLEDMKFKDFDYGKYIKSCGYKGLIYINKYEVIGESFLYTNLGKLKSKLIKNFRYLYKKNSDFLNSVLLGAKENLTQEDKEIFSKTGTSHIIAISGLHIGILCTLVILIIRSINKFYKLIILSVILSLYCIMVGVSPSIVRSILFIIALYLSIFYDKKKDGISTLSLIGIFFIINNPYIIHNISFQLSFLATLSIIYFYGYINNILKIEIISITLCANILTLPIIYYNFKLVTINSILGNLIIVPFIGVIMYLSIISIILFNINVWVAKVVAYFNIIIMDSIYFLLNILSRLDFTYVEVENPKIQYVIIYYGIVFSYMIYKELKVMKEQTNELQGYYKQY
ncbi:ComEC/Rec2 family competence protein [Romboutsia maritimum]|uniref:ComEC/Rec2 family competence protein n=1 Tax=Romboutsia maritimum TaxID=2020948 RepID=A0A371IU33_9FIRM|nr:ComEC/Rec2 family competence protein [Romboutsia maritimum]RDY23988.1 ComEC/Rec2 family competence protein [Romboutsia maritimum]